MSKTKIKSQVTPKLKFLALLILGGALVISIVTKLSAPTDINLVATKSAPPPNCTSWFDGCNTCMVKDGATVGCTKRACKGTPESPRCLSYTDATPTPTSTPTLPANCRSWFDGCNTCMVENGVISGCTKRACKGTPESPRCLSYIGTTPTPTSLASPTCVTPPNPCPSGAFCKPNVPLASGQVYCPGPRPSTTSIPTPTASPQIDKYNQSLEYFSATDTCGNNQHGFRNYQYACKDGERVNYYMTSDCGSFEYVMTQIQAICNKVIQGR